MTPGQDALGSLSEAEPGRRVRDTRHLGKGRASVQIHLWHQQTLPVDREGAGQDVPYPGVTLQSSSQRREDQESESEE